MTCCQYLSPRIPHALSKQQQYIKARTPSCRCTRRSRSLVSSSRSPNVALRASRASLKVLSSAARACCSASRCARSALRARWRSASSARRMSGSTSPVAAAARTVSRSTSARSARTLRENNNVRPSRNNARLLQSVAQSVHHTAMGSRRRPTRVPIEQLFGWRWGAGWAPLPAACIQLLHWGLRSQPLQLRVG